MEIVIRLITFVTFLSFLPITIGFAEQAYDANYFSQYQNPSNLTALTAHQIAEKAITDVPKKKSWDKIEIIKANENDYSLYLWY